GGLARAQPLLGLAAELRVGHLQAEHKADPVPDILGRQLDAARQQAAEVAELAQGIGEAAAQAVDVGAVLGGRDQVDVALLHQLASGTQATAQSTTSVSLARWPVNRPAGSN